MPDYKNRTIEQIRTKAIGIYTDMETIKKRLLELIDQIENYSNKQGK